MGAAERGLLRQGLRYSLFLRLTVVGVASLVSLVLEPGPRPAVTAAVVLALNAWNVWYARYRLTTTAGRWAIVADVVVMSAVCLTQGWTTTYAFSPTENVAAPNWVMVAAEITVVAYPWQVGTAGLAGVATTLLAAYLGGAALAQPGAIGVTPLDLWLVVEAALSWGLYRLVRRHGRAADEQVARGERLRRAAAVAAARRRDETEYLATLHDTASATLLMVGAGVVAGRQDWFAEQAARDLAAIDGPAAPGGDVDLIELLREVVAQSRLRVRWQAVESLQVSTVDATMLCHGTREALTNVLRHAETDEAEVVVSADATTVVVEIVDHGRGFDPARRSAHRHGVTGSLMARMARIGGDATVTSAPGRGTRVRMSCPLNTAAPVDCGRETELIATNFLQGLRWAVVVMSLVILLLLDLPKVLSNVDAYGSVAAQFVVMAGFFGLSVAVAVAMWRSGAGPLGWWRWPALVGVFALSVLATQSVLPDHRLGIAHWSEGDAGWWLVLLVLDSRVAVFVALLAAQYVLTIVHALVAGHAVITVAGMVNGTLIVLSYQLAISLIAAVLRGLAGSAARLAREEEDLRTAEAVEQQVHEYRRERFAGVAETTVPLLAGLASGELDPADESVRRSCAVEATRMRRIFAEAGDRAGESDLLLRELRACVDLAERNGVSVSFVELGARPEVPLPARRALTEPAVAVLATARGKVRLTVAGDVGTLTVSVVADRPPFAVPAPDHDGVRTTSVVDGDRLWIQTTWRGGS